ncbi:MAG: DUF853 family protein [Moraxella sp.]|nr:DUF853 family protein [Moraxella sp.]
MTSYVIAKDVNDGSDIALLGKMANRHGLIAGATGTGKTVSLRKLAESFSAAGVPVFLSDVKGDLSGLARAGDGAGKVGERIAEFGLGDGYLSGFPVRFWDVYGDSGIPVRVTISQMGAMLLARLMGLNDTQEGLLNIVFKVADDNGWHVIDLKDLRALLQHVADNAKTYRTQYGNIAPASVGAVQRGLLQLESEGAEQFFGEPSLNLADWIQSQQGKGVINILNSAKLMQSPRLYGAFLLWFLAELFGELPEVGDLDKPKLVLFFDEAHLLFDNSPKALIEQIEQVVRLIRSKGVGVYFVTQNPLDLPESILGQLGNRVQHALRAFTPKDQKAVRAAADTFRINPNIDTKTAITELGVGEALVSFLQADGSPSVVTRAWVLPPSSQLPPLDETVQKNMTAQDDLMGYYAKAVDNYSAFEALNDKAAADAKIAEDAATAAATQAANDKAQTQTQAQAQNNKTEKSTPSALDGFIGGLTGSRKKSGQGVAYNVADAVGNQLNKKATQAISRGLMGVIKNILK